MNKYPIGDAFLKEKTGSAEKVNLDGLWEHDFVDDNTPAGEKTRPNEVKNDTKR